MTKLTVLVCLLLLTPTLAYSQALPARNARQQLDNAQQQTPGQTFDNSRAPQTVSPPAISSGTAAHVAPPTHSGPSMHITPPPSPAVPNSTSH